MIKVLTTMLLLVLVSLEFVISNPIEDGLVVYFTFDEGKGKTITDFSGMGNDADIKGNVEWVEGKYDKGMQFDAKASYAEVSAGIIDQLEAVTITAWVKIEKMPTTHSYNIAGISRGAGTGLYVELYAVNLSAWQCFPNNTNASVPYVANFNEWHHIAGIYSGKEILLYIDGEHKAKGAAGDLPDTFTFPFRISGDHPETDTWGGSLNGVIDEVRLYGRVLSPDEIKTTMSQLNVSVSLLDSLSSTWSKIKTQY